VREVVRISSRMKKMKRNIPIWRCKRKRILLGMELVKDRTTKNIWWGKVNWFSKSIAKGLAWIPQAYTTMSPLIMDKEVMRWDWYYRRSSTEVEKIWLQMKKYRLNRLFNEKSTNVAVMWQSIMVFKWMDFVKKYKRICQLRLNCGEAGTGNAISLTVVIHYCSLQGKINYLGYKNRCGQCIRYTNWPSHLLVELSVIP